MQITEVILLFEFELYEFHRSAMGADYGTVITLNIGTPRPATVVVLNIKQFNFTLK